MHPAEEIIWLSIQKKDTTAFEGYYKEHYKEFFLTANNYVKNIQSAEEIVNDVFVKIWRDAEKITIETSLKAYIYRAVINQSINVLAKKQKELNLQQELKHSLQEFDLLSEMEANELKIKLYKSIDALPDQCKKVFVMSRFEQMKQKEIADKLGISIKTVKNHITHALKQLKKAAGYSLLFSFIIFSILLGPSSIIFVLSIIKYGIFS